jgi:acyl carrier protein
MERNTLLEKVREIILEIVDIESEKITREASLRNDLRVDSLASVEIVMALEDAFKIEIDEDLARGLGTVGDLIDAIEAMRAAQDAGAV